MMKAAAPITGGMSWPPVEPTDSIAAARYGVKPDLIMAGMVTMPTASTFDTALPEIMPNSAEPTTAILAAPPRNLPHRRHGEIGEEIRAAGARQHLAEDGVGDHHQHGDLKDRADHAVHVEADVGDHAFGRDPAGLEVAAQERADIDVGRDRQDDRDEAPAGDAPARVQHQEGQDGAADDALDRQHRELIGQRLVADGDVAREQQRNDGAEPVEPARIRGPAGGEGPRQRHGERSDHRPGDVAPREVAVDEVDRRSRPPRTGRPGRSRSAAATTRR